MEAVGRAFDLTPGYVAGSRCARPEQGGRFIVIAFCDRRWSSAPHARRVDSLACPP
jgi:hypothetical protein